VSFAKLAMDAADETTAHGIVAFLFEVVEAGTVAELAEVKPVLPTVMSVMKTHPRNQAPAERVVAIAVR